MKKFVFFIISFFIFISNINALTIAPVDITNASISDLQSYVEKGYITYEDITRIYLDRINAYDSNYDSIISLNQNAIEEAREADKIYQVSGASSPLFGIPILVKDNIDVIGMPTTAGSSALSDSYPSKNAYVVQKLLDAGAIILGKTNMSQFAIKASSSMSSYGIVKNSFNTLYSSYGSSGGSAVAVSLGFAVASLGTDTNSSTRVPASANNVVGIRPSIGLVSRDGILPYDSFRDTVGIISKYVDDSSIILDAIEGYDENDYESKSVLLQDDPYSMDGTLEGINIGVMEDWIDESDDDIQDLTYKAINQLEENGANIIYLNDFYTDEMDDINMSISSSVNLCDSFNDYIKNTSSSIKTFNDLVNSPGNIYNLKNYLNTCNKSDYYSKPNFDKRLKLQSLISDSMDKFGVDIIVYPTLSSDVSKLSNINESNYKSYSSYLAPSAGMPSISVPMGFGRNGLPYGLEFMSTQFNESSIYYIASIYQMLNDTIKIPKEVPNLYDISENVEDLKSIYESVYDDSRYGSYLKEIREYFKNYSSNDNRISDANNLIDEYDAVQNGVVYKSEILGKTITIIILIIILLYIIYKIRKKGKEKGEV